MANIIIAFYTDLIIIIVKMLRKDKSNRELIYDLPIDGSFKNNADDNADENKPIEFGNELDKIEIKPLRKSLELNQHIIFDLTSTLLFPTSYCSVQTSHCRSDTTQHQYTKSDKQIHNNLVKFKGDKNQNKKNIYELAIKYLQSMSASHDRSEQQACIEVFPNVYVNLDNQTSYKTSDDGKVYLTNVHNNRITEAIIDDNGIVINIKQQDKIINKTYSVIKYPLEGEKPYGGRYERLAFNIRDKKNFKHLKFQLNEDLEIIKTTRKRQSYINNLTRTAKYKKLYTPIALCGFDMFDEDRCCLCGQGCCDLDDVEKNSTTYL